MLAGFVQNNFFKKDGLNNMTDESQHVSPQQENPPLPQLQVPDSIPLQPQKSNKNTWIIVGVAIIALCLCSVICVAVFGTGLYKVYTEKAPVESVLDVYMQHMTNKDAESAYALFSPRARRQIPISKLQEMFEGNNYILFEDYKSLSVTNLNISASANTNPDLPQGTVAKVTGIIMFGGGFQGNFNGVLEKVNGEWMIDAMYVSVPPDKIK
jgi:hypothetical protein